MCAILGVLNMPNYVIWLDYLWSLVFGPDYRHDPVFIKAKEEAFELKDSNLANTEMEPILLDFAYRAYDEKRDLFFRLEAKRDEFLKFSVALLGFSAAAIGTKHVVLDVRLGCACGLLILATIILVLSRRAISVPHLSGVNDARRAYRESTVKTDWLIGNISISIAALEVINKHRAVHLNLALFALISTLISVLWWVAGAVR